MSTNAVPKTTTATLRSNSPGAAPTKFIRISQHPAPDLSHTIQIRSPPFRKHRSHERKTEHTLATEATLFNFRTSTFSFSNFGPFTHFLSQHTPANVASITTVHWEAHDSWAVAGGSTLIVAKMLVDRLPELREVVIRLIMPRSESENAIVRRNLKDWKEGLKGLKNGLIVGVKQQERRRFEMCVLGGSLRWVDHSGGKARSNRVNGWAVVTEQDEKDRSVVAAEQEERSGSVVDV
jgi:hypothetical protein